MAADTWGGMAGVPAAGDTHYLAIGNRPDVLSEFAIRCRRHNEHSIVLPISACDTPHVTHINISEGNVAGKRWPERPTGPPPIRTWSLPFAADDYHRYGADSAMYQISVLGRFSQGSADTLKPLPWILSAVEWWKDHTEQLASSIPISVGSETPTWG